MAIESFNHKIFPLDMVVLKENKEYASWHHGYHGRVRVGGMLKAFSHS